MTVVVAQDKITWITRFRRCRGAAVTSYAGRWLMPEESFMRGRVDAMLCRHV